MTVNIVKLNKELSTLRLEKQEVDKKLTSWTEEKTSFELKIKSLEEEVKQLKEKETQLKKDEAAVIIAVEESVNKKVVQSLAAIGVKEGTVKEETVSPQETADEIYKKYESLSGPEKIDYYRKNKVMILRAMKTVYVDKNPIAQKLQGRSNAKSI